MSNLLVATTKLRILWGQDTEAPTHKLSSVCHVKNLNQKNEYVATKSRNFFIWLKEKKHK